MQRELNRNCNFRDPQHHSQFNGSKMLSNTELKYGEPKAEIFSVITFFEKYRAFLKSAPFKLRVDNRVLSWLKKYWMDQSYIGPWIVRLGGWLPHDNLNLYKETRQNFYQEIFNGVSA